MTARHMQSLRWQHTQMAGHCIGIKRLRFDGVFAPWSAFVLRKSASLRHHMHENGLSLIHI
eukprot:1263506-Prorocentrum_lima.AAC.1